MHDKERVISYFMDSFLLWAVLVFDLLLKVSGNAEVNALNALKNNLADPNNVLQSWDPTQVNPCMWFRVTCNSDNRVTRIDLGDENLSGQLVRQLGQLLNLQYLELYKNNISGKIPDELGNLTNLVSLDLYLNKLTGPIPDTLGNLKRLLFLRLNNNSLSGSIPMSLTSAVSLQFLDLSNNQLNGDIPVNGSFSLLTPIRFQNNPGLKQQKFSSPSSISPKPPAPSGNSTTGAIAGGFAAGIFVLSFAAYAIAFAYWRRRKPKDHFFNALAKEDFDKLHGELNQFVLYDLQVATDNFSDKNIVGRGGSGTVYKGRLPDGSLVAVKRIRERSIQGGKQSFEAEMKMISMAVHRNLLRLIGFCRTPTEWLLVYPFMVNRCVASCLQVRPRTQPPLDWPTRRRIALGAARGIAYLHDHCDLKIIHRDIKPSNILLDGEFEAYIGDFGISKFMDYEDSHVTTSHIIGTVGYMDPDYLSTIKISEKNDVYGYGVVLLELITGKRPFDFARRLLDDDGVTLVEWVRKLVQYQKLERLVDADLQGNYGKEEVEQVTHIALLCTLESSINRPKMSEVILMLEDGDGLEEKWDKFQKDIFPQHFNHTTYDSNFSNWIEDSISYLSEDELSPSPR